MPFQIIRNDITKVRADAIVNTANPEPVYGGGTDAAIYRAAGEEKLLRERRKIGRINAGEVAVTPAFGLQAKYIIHTVGPVWIDGNHREYELLASCYRKSLLIARQLECKSIAFPLISTGVYGFPKDKALDIALDQISAFMEDSEMDVTLVVFDRRAFDLSASLQEGVRQFINENYVAAREDEEYGEGGLAAHVRNRRRRRDSDAGRSAGRPPRGLRDLLRETGERWRRKPGPDKEAGSRPSYSAQDSGFFAEEYPEEYEMSFSGTWDLESSALPDSAPQAESDSVPQAGPESASQAGSSLSPQAGPGPAPQAGPEAAPQAGPEAASQAGAGPAPRKEFRIESPSPARQRSLQDVMAHVGESFRDRLLRLIDERGLTDAQVYKRANLDRKLFSKIRCNADYTPKRKTAISLAVALELNMDETTDLLRSAGIALSPGSRFDLIISYCIQNGIYDIYRINALLFDYDQPLLGA